MRPWVSASRAASSCSAAARDFLRASRVCLGRKVSSHHSIDGTTPPSQGAGMFTTSSGPAARAASPVDELGSVASPLELVTSPAPPTSSISWQGRREIVSINYYSELDSRDLPEVLCGRTRIRLQFCVLPSALAPRPAECTFPVQRNATPSSHLEILSLTVVCV